MKLLFTISLAGLLLFACQVDKDLTNEKLYEKNGVIMQKKFEELIKETQFKTAFEKISKPKKGFSNKGSATSKTVMEDQYGFTISDYPVNVVVTGSITSYTFLITRENTTPNVFENLIVKLNGNQEPKAYILKYESNTSFAAVPYNYDTFQGTRTLEPIIYNASSVNSLYSDITCELVMTWLCDNHSEWQPGCEGHEGIGGIVCTGGGGSPNTGGGGDGYGGTTSGHEGNTNSGGGGVPTAPVVPCRVCPNLEDDRNLKNCEKLKKLIVTTPTSPNSNPFKNALIQNKSDVNNANNEKGYEVRLTNPALSTAMVIPLVNTNPSDCNTLSFIPRANTIGWFHSHPASCGLQEMFSYADLNVLYKIMLAHNGGNSTYPDGTSVDYSNFVITVATTFGTYAIKILDPDIFKSIMQDINSSEKKMKQFKTSFNQAQKRGQSNSLGVTDITAAKNEENMLDMIQNIFGSGVSLYKAKSDFSGFDRLEYENSQVTPKPCN